MKKVSPKFAEGMNMSLIPPGPKWTITCGNCGLIFKKRIQMVNNPALKCPFCDAVNVLNLKIDEGPFF